jgi:excisionase family DNA binding protein
MENTLTRSLPDVLTVEEARAILRVSKNTIYEAINRGEIPSIRMGRTIRIPRKGLEKLLETPASVTDSVTDSAGETRGSKGFLWDEQPGRTRTRGAR